MAFPSLGSRPQVRLSFELKCLVSTGIVLFNSGGPLYADFIAVELVDGYVTLRVNKGAGDVTMTSRAPVNDAQWHQVRETETVRYVRYLFTARRNDGSIVFIVAKFYMG